MPVTATARLRYVSIPARKMRLVADMIRGLPVEKALNILNFTPRVAAYHLAKTLKSAAANALSLEGTDHVHPEDLRVKTIMVDGGPAAKRIRFQSMGRVFRYRKNHCHVTIVLEEIAKKKAAPMTTARVEGAEGATKVAAKPARKTTTKTKKTTSTAAKKKTPAKKTK